MSGPGDDLSGWTGVARPLPVALEGRYTRLDPLDPARHGADLFASAQAEAERFRYLFDEPPQGDRAAFDIWLTKARGRIHRSPVLCRDRQATGRAEGRQTLMRIVRLMV